MNKYHFFVVYVCASRDRLAMWRHLVLISLATLKKTHKQLLFGDKIRKTLHEWKDSSVLAKPLATSIPIHLQRFPSYSNRKCKKSPFSRTAAHIFVSPGDAPAIITPYLQYTSNLTKDISSLVYCLIMFDVCHMFVLKYYLRPIFNSF